MVSFCCTTQRGVFCGGDVNHFQTTIVCKCNGAYKNVVLISQK